MKNIVKKTPTLVFEAGLNLSYALFINIILLFILTTESYSFYALGITAAAIASLTSVGVQTLVPEYYAQDHIPEQKIWFGIQFQLFLVIFYILLFIVIPNNILNGIFENIVITKKLIICSSLYFFSQCTDDAIHILLRISQRASLSLKISILCKITFFSTAVCSAIYTADGYTVFFILTILMNLTTALKFIFIIIPRVEIKFISFKAFPSLLNHFSSVWLGNVSNTIFNGVMRIVIGDTYGTKIIGIMTIASQIGTAFSVLTSSLTLNIVLESWKNSVTNQDLKIKFSAAKKRSIFLSLICFIVTLSAISFIFYFKDDENFSIYNLFYLIMPLSVAYSVSVFNCPYYQICQFYGRVRYISLANFIFGLGGLGAMVLLVYVAEIPSVSNLILMLVAVMSTIFIVLLYKNTQKTLGDMREN